jgi:type II secretory pathway pseudopilin PulG
MGASRRGVAGFTLLEMTLVTSLMVAIFTALALGVRSGYAANAEIERRTALTLVADDLMDRLFRIDYGLDSDGAASATELTELFDDTEALGSATLQKLHVFAGSAGYEFELANFPWPGQFEITVIADLNDDGDETDPNEGTTNIFRVNINFIRPDGQVDRVLECMRAKPIG